MTPEQRESMVTEHLPLADRTARGVWLHTGRGASCEDLVQVGRCALLEAIDSWHGALSPLEPWIMMNVRWACLESVRTEYRRTKGEVGIDDPDVFPAEAVPQRESTDTEREIDRAIEALPPKQRMLIRAIYWQGTTQAQLAKELRMHPVYLSELVGDALRTLRKQLARKIYSDTEIMTRMLASVA